VIIAASRCWLIALAVIALGFARVGQSRDFSAVFPSTQVKLSSPNGEMTIVNHDPDDNDHPHKLMLVQPARPDVMIYSYRRHVRVAWDPKSKMLFINDYAESTNSTCVLIDASNGEKTDLLQKAKAFNDNALKILSNPHAYLECQRWLSTNTLLVTAHGYGTSGTADHAISLRYTLDTGFSLR